MKMIPIELEAIFFISFVLALVVVIFILKVVVLSVLGLVVVLFILRLVVVLVFAVVIVIGHDFHLTLR